MSKIETFVLDAWEVLRYDDWDPNPARNNHVAFFKNESDARELAEKIHGGHYKKVDRKYAIYSSIDEYTKHKKELDMENLYKKAKKVFSDDELKKLGIVKPSKD